MKLKITETKTWKMSYTLNLTVINVADLNL